MIQVKDAADLRAFLQRYGVTYANWPAQGSKSVDTLFAELKEAEYELMIQGGQVIRLVRVLLVDVWCVIDGNSYYLYEDCQVLHGGREIRRQHLLASIGEKLKLDELSDEDALRRALKEEIGVARWQNAQFTGMERGTDDFGNYPGLISQFIRFRWRVELNPGDFLTEGYVEQKPDKAIYFRWSCQA